MNAKFFYLLSGFSEQFPTRLQQICDIHHIDQSKAPVHQGGLGK